MPEGTKSLVLIVNDPDAPDPKAPKMTWIHWVAYNISPTVKGIEEGAAKRAMPPGAREGTTSWKRTGCGGSCPPIGRHRYFHTLYALDVELPDVTNPTKAALEGAMGGHGVGHAEIIGTYEKVRK